mgnify:CR=1 FL=1
MRERGGGRAGWRRGRRRRAAAGRNPRLAPPPAPLPAGAGGGPGWRHRVRATGAAAGALTRGCHPPPPHLSHRSRRTHTPPRARPAAGAWLPAWREGWARAVEVWGRRARRRRAGRVCRELAYRAACCRPPAKENITGSGGGRKTRADRPKPRFFATKKNKIISRTVGLEPTRVTPFDCLAAVRGQTPLRVKRLNRSATSAGRVSRLN